MSFTENAYSKSKFIIFKLVTGEDIIGEVIDSGNTNIGSIGEHGGLTISDSHSYVKIKQPVVVVLTERGMSFIPYAAFAIDEVFTLFTTKIVGYYEPVEGVLNHYKKFVNPDQIVVPDKKIIV